MTNTGMIMFFVMILAIIVTGVGSFIYFQYKGPERKTIICKNEKLELSFVIHDQDKAFVIAGEQVNPKNVSIFNESTIAASWTHNTAATKIFLDRITGKLELETKTGNRDWEKNILECQYKAARF